MILNPADVRQVRREYALVFVPEMIDAEHQVRLKIEQRLADRVAPKAVVRGRFDDDARLAAEAPQRLGRIGGGILKHARKSRRQQKHPRRTRSGGREYFGELLARDLR